MSLKYFEIRDMATYCPVMAVKLKSDDEAENYLLRRAGCSGEIWLTLLTTLQSRLQPSGWSDDWFKKVHEYIVAHFDDLKSGQVIDMQYARGESEKPKIAERLFFQPRVGMVLHGDVK